MIRAILKNGTIQPVTSLPGDWSDGQELVVEKAMSPTPVRDLERWSREIDELAQCISPEDFERLDSALAEADQEAKDDVRRQMGLGWCRATCWTRTISAQR